MSQAEEVSCRVFDGTHKLDQGFALQDDVKQTGCAISRGLCLTKEGDLKDGQIREEDSTAAQEAFEKAAQAEERATHADLPKIDFPAFLLSLHHSALMQLGEIEGGTLNLTMAKQLIDTIEMLREKTTGNLEGEEEKLMRMLLFELKMKYVEHQKAGR